MKKNIIIGYTNSKSEEKRVAFELFNYYSNTKDFNVEIIDFSSCFDADKNFRKILFHFFSMIFYCPNVIFSQSIKCECSRL